MSAEQTDTMQWYFCFRVLNPPGSWVVQGPFATSDMAKAAREKAKIWGGDGEIGTPFPARTREEAERKCETGQTY